MTETETRVKEIKQGFRQMKDGAMAQSRRQKGLDYSETHDHQMPRYRTEYATLI